MDTGACSPGAGIWLDMALGHQGGCAEGSGIQDTLNLWQQPGSHFSGVCPCTCKPSRRGLPPQGIRAPHVSFVLVPWICWDQRWGEVSAVLSLGQAGRAQCPFAPRQPRVWVWGRSPHAPPRPAARSRERTATPVSPEFGGQVFPRVRPELSVSKHAEMSVHHFSSLGEAGKAEGGLNPARAASLPFL